VSVLTNIACPAQAGNHIGCYEVGSGGITCPEYREHIKVSTFREEGSTKLVDMAGIVTRIFTLRWEISSCREHLREVSRGHSSYEERAIRTMEVSQISEGLNIGLRPNSIGSTVSVQPYLKQD
jgi:hypothetical protein